VPAVISLKCKAETEFYKRILRSGHEHRPDQTALFEMIGNWCKPLPSRIKIVQQSIHEPAFRLKAGTSDWLSLARRHS